MSREGQLKLGTSLHGVGSSVSGWRHPDLPADASINIDFYIQQVSLILCLLQMVYILPSSQFLIF